MANNINFLKDILIAELQKQPIYYNLPPYSRDIVTQVISKVALSSSQKITKDVQLFSNNQIVNNQKNIVGPYNQYDVVNSNINSNTLTNRLLPNATQQLLGGLTNDMVFNLLKGLNDKLPSSFRGIIDLNQLTGVLTNIAGGVVNTGIKSSLSTYSGQILSGNRINIPILGGLDANFAALLAGNPAAALGRIESVFASAVTQKALNAAQSFNINNPLNKEKLITQTKGFNDPTATYPTKEYKSQPDTNKLARGDVKGTIVQEKEQERLKGIQLPNGQSWEEPPPAFKGQYPYNKVTET